MFYDGYYVEYLFLQYLKEHEKLPDANVIEYNTSILHSCGGFSPTEKYATVEQIIDISHPCYDKIDKKLCELLRAFFYFNGKTTTFSCHLEIADYFANEFPKYIDYLEQEKLVIKQPDGRIELFGKAEEHITSFEKMQEMRRQTLGETEDDDKNTDQPVGKDGHPSSDMAPDDTDSP